MKIVHTSIAVKDMDESIKFYVGVLGLKLLRRMEIPRGKMEKRPESSKEIAFLGDGESEIELTHWKEKKDWTSGDELDHIALAVPDMDEALKIFKEHKVEIVREPFSRGGSIKVAFIKDPNGIWLEIFERK